MKVTPLEIRQKTFERTLRGYDKDEVNAFLLSLSQEWERMMDEMKEARLKLENAEKEVAKLREVESSLFKTLKTAEDTGANVIEQANKAAELHVMEAQLRAEAMMNEARVKAKNTMEEADAMSRELLSEMEDNLKELVNQYKTIESQRNNLVDDLRRLAQESIDRAERVKQSFRSFSPDEHLNLAKRELKKSTFTETESKRITVETIRKHEDVRQEPARSFFDEVA